MAWRGSWTKRSVGHRDYCLYVPESGAGRGKLPLLVMLHGCTQDPESFALDTGMNDLAEKHGFVVLYPQQEMQYNAMKCWNWFLPESQRRDGGELGIVMGMLEKVRAELPIDPSRIYAAGLSAGGALAANLVACYADVFAGAGIHTGVEYQGAVTLEGAYSTLTSGATGDLEKSAREALRNSGEAAKVPAVFLISGTADVRVHTSNAVRLLKQMCLIQDLMTGGEGKADREFTPARVESGQVSGGYSYTADIYEFGGAFRLKNVSVRGLAHAWSGARRSGPFADPKGPDATTMLWEFLWEHSAPRV